MQGTTLATRTTIIHSVDTIQSAGEPKTVANTDGTVRIAYLGDKVFLREMIMTSANAAVHVQVEDGCPPDLDHESEMTLSADVEGVANVMLAQAAQTSAAAIQATLPSEAGKVVGTITMVVGSIRIIGIDGVPRVAMVGDKVYSRETLATESDGILRLQLENGKLVDLGRDSKLALTDEIIAEAGAPVPGAAPATTPSVGAEQDAAAIQLIAAGADPAQVAAAIAAGGVVDGSGGTPVVLIDQSSSTGEVTSGFPTQPAGISFPEIEPAELAEAGAPTVAVSNVGPFTEVANGLVSEVGLDGGTQARSNRELDRNGQVQLEDPDGRGEIASMVTEDGTSVTFSIADLMLLVEGSGNDILIGGGGSDTFKFTDESQAEYPITNFALDRGNDGVITMGDVFDLTGIIVTPDGDGNTIVSVNPTGAGVPADYQPLVTPAGVTTNLTDLVNDKQIVY
jgi:hypothetical protein